MAQLPQKIGEFSILPISLPPTASYPVNATHCLYLRPHAPKVPTAADSRSLFLVNVPFDSTEAHFRAVFNALVGVGRFESIIFESEKRTQAPTGTVDGAGTKEKSTKRKRWERGRLANEDKGDLPRVWDRELHRGGSTAVAVMADDRSVEAVLKAVRKVHKSGAYPVWGAGIEDKVPELGLQRYLTHHKLRYPDKATLQASVDAFMTAFSEKEEEVANAAKRARNMPDEDGFITVTRGGRTGPARIEEAEEARRKELEKREEKRRTMGDFYRFQAREKRKEQQNELMKKFEEDRQKVESMRKERKSRFRPE